jgi:hypothetical protein
VSTKKLSKLQTSEKLHGSIKSVSIEGFRSLAKVQNLELPQLAVLIGSNGAGKSNFIRFFDLLGWMLRGQNLQEFVLKQGGADDQLFMGARRTSAIHAEIGIQTQSGRNDYRFALAHLSVGNMLMVTNEAYRYSNQQAYASDARWTNLPIATQSPYMVDCFELENIIVANMKDGATTLKNLPREQYQAWLDDEYLLSDIWLKDVVGGAQ